MSEVSPSARIRIEAQGLQATAFQCTELKLE